MQDDTQIGPGHVFTVMDATGCSPDMVMVGDKQTWNPDKACVTGTMSVTRDGKPVPFWDGKVFTIDRFDKNRYATSYVQDGQVTTITLVYEQGRHLSLLNPVWMIYGDCTTKGAACEIIGDPSGWGGQNAR